MTEKKISTEDGAKLTEAKLNEGTGTVEVATGIKNSEEAKAAGIEVFGDPDTWKLLAKAHNNGMMKSTKVMNLSTGCLVQVSTLYLNKDGTKSVAEALQFVPGCHLDTRGEFPEIVSIAQAKS